VCAAGWGPRSLGAGARGARGSALSASAASQEEEAEWRPARGGPSGGACARAGVSAPGARRPEPRPVRIVPERSRARPAASGSPVNTRPRLLQL